MARTSRVSSWLFIAALAVAAVAGASAQQVLPTTKAKQLVVSPDNPIWASDVQDPTTPPQTGGDQTATPAGRGGRGATSGPPALRPYAQVVTAQAKTDKGVFTIHRVGEQLLYEIPKSELDKDFLWTTEIKQTPNGAGYGGQAVDNHVIRWQLMGTVGQPSRVLLRQMNYSLVASDKSNPVAKAVENANLPPIVKVFNVETYSQDGAPVIDATSLFTSDVPEFSARGAVGGRSMDATRSWINKAVAYPININVEVTQTFSMGAADAGAAAPAGAARGGARGNSGTVTTFYSMVKLPEDVMQPRLFDERVGYFSTSNHDITTSEHKLAARTFITRYRLVKKDPSAAVSEPVNPIVYYIDPATPPQWIPWVKKAIEDWQPAFEMAGFKNAIIAKEAPRDDPNWSIEDARYSVIDWLPSTTENAVGPHVHDPRSGEIINAHVQLYHNVMNLASMWYFTQVGPLDPRAAKLPLSDDLMGRLLEYVICHEVGHTIGFQHNMKSSSEYTIAQIRDKNWVKENGHVATLMDYSRFNYVAQPEDGIAVADLIPKIGPYDKWATMWGYKPIPTAKSADEEKKTLDEWARQQDTTPWLRFSTAGQAGSDPGDETEAVGDADATTATGLGLKNLKKVADMMLAATSGEVGAPYDDLNEVYGRVLSQWTTELNHVSNVVGGYDSQEKHIGQQGVRFTAVSKVRQAAAVQFLLANAFQKPSWLLKPDVLRRIQATGAVNRIRTAQTSVLNSLMQPARMDRLVEQAAVDGGDAYTPLQFLGDLRKGIWSELGTPAVPIDVFRRNTQRAYLDTFDNRINESTATSDEVRALLKGELKTLDAQIKTAMVGVTDVATRRHLDDARGQIADILDSHAMRTPPPAGAAGRGGRGGFTSDGQVVLDSTSGGKFDFDHDPFLLPPTGCWLDRIIK
jgi:hypothetical protein